MKNNSDRKPRKHHTVVELRENTVLHFDAERGVIEFRDSDGNLSQKNLVSVGEGYDRNGKAPKVLRLWPTTTTEAPFNIQSIEGRFDEFFVIDTNHRDAGKFRLCVATGIRVFSVLSRDDGKVSLSISYLPSLVFLCGEKMKPERYGWFKLIDGILKLEDYSTDKRYAIIGDCDLGDHQKINSREAPVVDAFFLPSGFSLAYASSDAGSENWPNKLIKICDKISGLVLAGKMENADWSQFEHRQFEYLDLELIDHRDSEYLRKATAGLAHVWADAAALPDARSPRPEAPPSRSDA